MQTTIPEERTGQLEQRQEVGTVLCRRGPSEARHLESHAAFHAEFRTHRPLLHATLTASARLEAAQDGEDGRRRK
jgi:hypothetical protein